MNSKQHSGETPKPSDTTMYVVMNPDRYILGHTTDLEAARNMAYWSSRDPTKVYKLVEVSDDN